MGLKLMVWQKELLIKIVECPNRKMFVNITARSGHGLISRVVREAKKRGLIDRDILCIRPSDIANDVLGKRSTATFFDEFEHRNNK